MIRRFHATPIHLQVGLVLATIPIVVALFGTTFARVAIDVALDGEDTRLVHAITQAVRVAVGLTVACATVAAAGAALLLRGSIRAVIDHLRDATVAISDGQFGHRVGGERRRDELGHLAHAIDAMAMRLEQLEQARRRLLACVSHELRTPLTIVRGHAYTLARDEVDPARSARFDLIESEAARLATLMGDLLDAASLHAGGVRLARERCALRDVITGAACRVDDAAREAGVELRLGAIDARAELDVDAERIDQALVNLLLNAVRHAPSRSRVDIDVSMRDARSCVITISNRSAPIPTEVAERIFDPFVQHGSVRGSVGLGLGIARDLVEAHGGTLQLVARGVDGFVALDMELPLASKRHRVDVSRARAARWSSKPRWT
ncbi:MAG: HAMP domain-containing histidine kinase [Thermoleophilia bacterium]|nr:HAMP domain-containing histidine kinase [Thermoleophilia bacterium]